jgi:acetoin:2,6-dichlorophenolindophenol oxidoreductase subunit alpha
MPMSTRLDASMAQLRTMLRIRRFEEALVRLSATHDFGHYHVAIGQEATAVPALEQLQDGDVSYTTHRNHGHLIARGVDPKRMLAEIFGRADGTNRGKSGTLHLASAAHGFPTTSASVGGCLPLAVGSGFAFRELGLDRVSVCLFGDGALEEGAWHEAANIAALRQLPVVFLCENNAFEGGGQKAKGYHESSLAVQQLTDLAEPFGIPTVAIDGADADAVAATMGMAIGRARRGEGPTFVEARTIRWPGNRMQWPQMVTGETDVRYAWDDGLIPEAHRDWFGEQDGLLRSLRQIVQAGMAREAVERLDAEIQSEMEAAVAFADASPWPAEQSAREDVYASRS